MVWICFVSCFIVCGVLLFIRIICSRIFALLYTIVFPSVVLLLRLISIIRCWLFPMCWSKFFVCVSTYISCVTIVYRKSIAVLRLVMSLGIFVYVSFFSTIKLEASIPSNKVFPQLSIFSSAQYE